MTRDASKLPLSVACRARTQRCFIALSMILALPVHGQDRKLSQSVLTAASEAIRSELGCVLVVTIRDTWEPGPRSRAFCHLFDVEEVLKPYRNDTGVYWIPTHAVELTAEGNPELKLGKRYLIVAHLDSYTVTLLGIAGVDEHVEMSPEDDELLRPLRTMVERDAVYGSSELLELWLSMRSGFEVWGRSSPYADGRVDPAVYGLTEDIVRDAKVRETMDVLVVRIGDVTWTSDQGTDLTATVIEDLLGKGTERGKDLRLHDSETRDQQLTRAEKVPTPYKVPRATKGAVYVVLVELRPRGQRVVRVTVPVLREDDPTVHMIREWVRRKEDAGPPWRAISTDLTHNGLRPRCRRG